MHGQKRSEEVRRGSELRRVAMAEGHGRRSRGDGQPPERGLIIYMILLRDLLAEGFEVIEHREALTLEVLLKFSPIGIVLRVGYDEEGVQAVFSVRFGANLVVAPVRR